MAHALTTDDILFRQRLLSCSGLYHGRLDGRWGAMTDAADQAFFAECDRVADQVGRFDARTERHVRSLRLPAQGLARRSLAAIRAGGIDARIISGTRTYAEQAALYRQGRHGNTGPRVTNAKAGQSWHNFALAWDIGIFRGGVYLTDGRDYHDAARLGRIAGVEWGGDWRRFPDPPHYQAPFEAATIAAARAQFECGGKPA